MYKQTITYADVNGEKRTEDFYFNLTKAELTKLQMSVDGGWSEQMRAILAKMDMPKLIAAFDDLIDRSYGVKTPDGRGFQKNKEILESFKCTEAYSVLFMELLENTDKAIEFFKGIVPADLAEQVKDTDFLPAQ